MPAPVVPDWVGAATQSVTQPAPKAYQIQQPSAQQVEAMQQQLYQSIVQELMQTIDGFITPGATPSTQLASWAQEQNAAAANWETLFEDLGAPVSTATELADWLTGINTNTSTANTGWQWIVDQFNQLAYNNATTNNPLASITAAIQALLNNIPATSITSASPSLQLVSDFPTAASMVPGNGWSYDAVNGLTSAGCASYACSGTPGSLYGNWIPVNPGDVMTPQANAAWTGLTATGSPIALNLRTDTGALTTIQALANPGASSATYAGAVAGAAGTLHWVPLGGTYTVPAGVGFVRSELYVGATATAGTVEFSNAPDYRSDSWLTSQLDGMNTDITGILNAFATGNTAELTSSWNNLMGLLGTTASAMLGGPNSTAFWNGIIADFLNTATTLEVQANNIIGAIEQSAVSGLTSVWNWLTGTTTPTSTTKVLATAVAPVLGGSSLGADVSSVNTTTNNQSNWWTQLLSELGLSGGTNTGTNVGGAIAANTTNQTNTWSWLFGTTTPTSTTPVQTAKVATPLGGTNLSADLTALGNLLFGAPTVGTAVQAAALPNIPAGTGPGQSSDLLSHLNNVASVNNGQGTTPLAAALQSLQLLSGTVNTLSAKVQQNSTQDTGASNSGQSFAIYFANYANWASVPVNTTYGNIPGASSHGTGSFYINSNGQAAWQPVNNGDVSGMCIFNGDYPTGQVQAYTDTDYQELQASLSGLPNGGNAKNFGVVRANAISSPTDYVYGDVYLTTGFALMYEVGCYIGGTRYVWATGSVGTINLNFTLIAGVGNNPNRYQGYSGSTLVFDHTNSATDPGGLYPVGVTHRYWGFRSDTYNNGQNYPGPANYVGCADNQPPTIPGSGVRLYRTQTASVGESLGLDTVYTTWGDGTNQFFDAVSEQSIDMTVLTNVTIGSFNSSTAIGGNAGVQVANAGRYNVAARVDIGASNTSAGAVSMCLAVLRYNSAGALQETRLMPAPAFFVNGFGGQYNTGFAGASVTMGCQAGDILQLGHFLDPGTSGTGRNGAGTLTTLQFTGEATGSHSYMEVVLANWSLN